jgi:hypothetical protein
MLSGVQLTTTAFSFPFAGSSRRAMNQAGLDLLALPTFTTTKTSSEPFRHPRYRIFPPLRSQGGLWLALSLAGSCSASVPHLGQVIPLRLVH